MARFLILGSASPELLQQSSESLAGRVSYPELSGFTFVKNKRIGFEIQRTTTPTITKSMRQALPDLKLDRLIVIHAGDASYPLAKKVYAVAASKMLEDLAL